MTGIYCLSRLGGMNKSYKLFIFDFDGTVGNTKECIIASFQEALRKNDLPIVDREEIIHYYMGVSLRETFKKLTHDKYNNELYEKLVTDYRIFYRGFLTKKTFTFPEATEALKKIKQEKHLISIATAKKNRACIT